jgi:hypothetical protein
MKPKLVVILLFALLPLNLTAEGNAPSPDGDHVVSQVGLALDAAIASNQSFVRSVKQGRSSEAVAAAAEVMAGYYDQLCTQLAQYSRWWRSISIPITPDQLSDAGAENDFYTKLQVFSISVYGPPLFDNDLAPYRSDPKLIVALAKITATYHALQTLVAEALKAPIDAAFRKGQKVH